MHDIQFNLEEVRRFHAGTRAIERDMIFAQEFLKKSLADVTPFWKDDAILAAERDIAEIDRRMRTAILQLDEAIDGAIRREIEWAERYRHAIR